MGKWYIYTYLDSELRSAATNFLRCILFSPSHTERLDAACRQRDVHNVCHTHVCTCTPFLFIALSCGPLDVLQCRIQVVLLGLERDACLLTDVSCFPSRLRCSPNSMDEHVNLADLKRRALVALITECTSLRPRHHDGCCCYCCFRCNVDDTVFVAVIADFDASLLRVTLRWRSRPSQQVTWLRGLCRRRLVKVRLVLSCHLCRVLSRPPMSAHGLRLNTTEFRRCLKSLLTVMVVETGPRQVPQQVRTRGFFRHQAFAIRLPIPCSFAAFRRQGARWHVPAGELLCHAARTQLR